MGNLLYYLQLFAEAAAGVFGVRLYEEPPHAVIDRLPGGVEVRRYEARVAAEVLIPGQSGKEGANLAFQALFDYIAAQQVSMTTPVERAAAVQGTKMRFFLPAKYSAQTAPPPADPRVRIVELPPGTVSILRFSGSPNEDDIARRRAALLAALEATAWRATAEPVVLYYDAPFTLPFVRRNEIAAEVIAR